ncbi:MAG TPA: hypothetical protein VHE61_22935 [Opitutaceae bacterium]|nr:hypothetical protein [Opitutaceae bacterium]
MNAMLECAPHGVVAQGRTRPKHNVIITGTGRAGTTFLVRLLTALGQDTGYDTQSWRADYFPHCSAGLEHDLADAGAPYIVKNPELCVTLDGILAAGGVIVDHAIIPVRDLEEAARSRARIGGENGTVPGGLVGTGDPKHQGEVLAERFHRLVQTLVTHDIPYTFLLFPRFVSDAEYAFSKLSAALPSLDRARFMAVFPKIADPGLVHDFSRSQPAPSADAARFEEAQRSKRRWRRVRRIAAWCMAVAVIGFALGWRWQAGSPAAAGAAIPTAAPVIVAPTAAAPKVRPFNNRFPGVARRRLHWRRRWAPDLELNLSTFPLPPMRPVVSPVGAPELPTEPLFGPALETRRSLSIPASSQVADLH